MACAGLLSETSTNLQQWRVYFVGRLTAPKFSSRAAAMGYLGALKTGNRKPEFAQASNGKEVR